MSASLFLKKLPATLKIVSGTGIFLWILPTCQEHLFYRVPPGDYLRLLERFCVRTRLKSFSTSSCTKYLVYGFVDNPANTTCIPRWTDVETIVSISFQREICVACLYRSTHLGLIWGIGRLKVWKKFQEIVEKYVCIVLKYLHNARRKQT